MKIVDLSHEIYEGMPVYPGCEGPRLKTANTYATDGFKETVLTMYSHTGTHIDPPAHLLADGATLDSFAAEQFIGKGLVIDCTSLEGGEEISLCHIEKYGSKVEDAEFLLFNTGWSKKWGSEDYYKSFPCMSKELIEFIAKGGYKGIGFDVISIDPVGEAGLKRHNLLFKNASLINVENLTNLDKCGDDLFTFICLPIKIKNSDGAPTRAIAIIEE